MIFDSTVDFWRENSNKCSLNINVRLPRVFFLEKRSNVEEKVLVLIHGCNS